MSGVPSVDRPFPTSAEIERFLTKFKRGDGCWEWQAGTNKDGYGQFYTRPVPGGPQVCWKAHRLSYFIHKGHLPSGLVCHTCDNPRCVNPAHLFEGTIQTNMNDRNAKGRQTKRANHPRAKLSEEQARSIRESVVPGSRDCGVSAAARKHGVSRRAIRKILTGENWRDVGH